MLIDEIRLIGLTVISLPIFGAKITDQFVLKNVDGLGPPDNAVYITGNVYQYREPANRELVFQLGLNPNFANNQTVSDLRTLLYGMLTGGVSDTFTVQLLLNGVVQAKVNGYTKSLVPNHFSKDPEVQLTIDCVSAFFSAPDSVQTPITELNRIHPIMANKGTAPCGFYMAITLSDNRYTVSIENTDESKVLSVTYETGFQPGDTLIFDTREGTKGLFMVRNGVTTNLLPSISNDSEFFLLHGGDNSFTMSTSAFNWVELSHIPRFWGV